MQEEYTNVITLTDSDGSDVDFEVLDIVPYKEHEYVVMLPVDDESDSPEAVILELLEAEGALRVDAGRGELLLSREEAMRIGVGEHFVRKNDPILLGGCCASGNMTELFKRMEDCFEEEK